jgi:hypothetical protein
VCKKVPALKTKAETLFRSGGQPNFLKIAVIRALPETVHKVKRREKSSIFIKLIVTPVHCCVSLGFTPVYYTCLADVVNEWLGIDPRL